MVENCRRWRRQGESCENKQRIVNVWIYGIKMKGICSDEGEEELIGKLIGWFHIDV